MILFGELVDANGNPVLAALDLRPINNRCEIGDFIKMTSAYGKENTAAVQHLLDTSDILYINPDKKRTDSWLQARRLQLPVGVASRYGSIEKVTYVDRNVNGNFTFSGNVPQKTAMQAAFEKAETDSVNTCISSNGEKRLGR